MDSEHFPHADAGTAQPELHFRDFNFCNYNINHDKLRWLLGDHDIVDGHRLETDFDQYTVADWTVTTTEAGQGAASEAVIDMVNGVLLVTNDVADDDSDELVWAVKTFNLKTGFPLYFEVRIKVSDVLQSDLWFGLVDTTAGYFGGGVDNGAYFLKADGSAALYGVTEDGGVAAAHLLGVSLVNATWVRLGIHWDGAGTVRFFVFTDSVPSQVCTAVHEVTTYIPDDAADLLAPGFGIRNGEAAAKSLWIDYLKAVQYRVI